MDIYPGQQQRYAVDGYPGLGEGLGDEAEVVGANGFEEEHWDDEMAAGGGESLVGGAVDAAGGDASGSGKLFIGGITWDTSEESFRQHFEEYGVVADSVIMRDKHTGNPRGFGFVTFADPSIVERVLEDEHFLDGKLVEVKRTVPREVMSSKHGPKTKKIFVGGLPTSLTEDELKDYFSSYGNVVEHQIMFDHNTGRSRGFGFVTFDTDEAVEIVLLDGRMHNVGGKQVEIKRAEPKHLSGNSSVNARFSRASRGPFRGSDDIYGYGAMNYRSAGAFYGYGGYGYGGSGFSAGYGGSFYGGAYGSFGLYGAYTASVYGAPGGAYGSGFPNYAGRRGQGRYHPYTR